MTERDGRKPQEALSRDCGILWSQNGQRGLIDSGSDRVLAAGEKPKEHVFRIRGTLRAERLWDS